MRNFRGAHEERLTDGEMTFRGSTAMESDRESLGNWARFGAAGLAVLLLACRTAELSGKGADVVTSQSAPIDSGFDPKSCKHLGFIVGKGGGAFGGAWIANEELVNYAMNDLRNQAAARGANFVQHDTPQMGVAGDGNGGSSTTTATVSGNAYYCSDQRSPSVTTTPKPTTAPAPKPLPSAPTRAVPEGVAGFRLGSSLEQAQKICEGAGHQFSPGDPAAKCSSSVVDLKAPAEVELTFCNDKACGIAVTLTPEAAALAPFIDSLSKQLTLNYGAKTLNQSNTKLCSSLDALAQCVLEGNAIVHHEWNWPSKHSVTLSTVKSNGKACVKLVYLTPEYTKTRVPGPAL